MAEEKKKKELSTFLRIVITINIYSNNFSRIYLFYVKGKLDKIQKVELPTGEELGITETVSQNLTGYRNIAIFGVDSRSDDYGVGNRSDCIIIASINNDTGEIKLISVCRN